MELSDKQVSAANNNEDDSGEITQDFQGLLEKVHWIQNSSKKKTTTTWLSFASIYVPIILIACAVQYFGGVNEAMIAAMSLELSFYGFIYGGKSVYADTEYGRLKGFTTFSRDGKEFYEFLGVPYAAPPVGPLRFQVSSVFSKI